MKQFLCRVVAGVLVAAGASAQLIDFEDVDPNLVRPFQGPDSCIADFAVETQGFAFRNTTNCAAYYEYFDIAGSTSLALYMGGRPSGSPAIVNMYNAENRRFDLLELDQLLGARDRMTVVGFRDGAEVYREELAISSGFVQNHQLGWTDLDSVTFRQDDPGVNAVGFDNVLVNVVGPARAPTLAIADEPVVIEGDVLEFRLTLSIPSSQDISFDVQTINESAVAPDDYLSVQTRRTLPAGATELIVQVPTVDDSNAESDEQLLLRVANLVNARFADSGVDAYTTGVIEDNDQGSRSTLIDFEEVDRSLLRPPQSRESCIPDFYFESKGFAFENPALCSSLYEYMDDGNPSLGVYFAQSFDTPRDSPAWMDIYPVDRGRFDLLELDQLRGASSVMLAIGYRDGLQVEGQFLLLESGFTRRHQLGWRNLDKVRLLTATPFPNAVGFDNVLVSRGDSSGLPEIRVSTDPDAKEGDFLKFRIELSKPLADIVSFELATVDDSAVAPADYKPRSGRRAFAPGQTRMTIWVPTVDDSAIEANEKLRLVLSNPSNATLAADGAEAIGRIADNDDPSRKTRVTVADAVAEEGNYARFVVSLSRPTSYDVRIIVNTQSGSATESQDFERKRGIRRIPAGQTEKTIFVELYDDDEAEGEEQFTLQVTAQSNNARLGDDGTATGTILSGDD